MPGCGIKSFIKVFTVSVRKRFAKELINPYALAASLAECILADFPPVKIQGKSASCKAGHAYRIQRAGYRLFESAFFYCAKTSTVLKKMTVCTFAGPLYQRRYDISIPVYLEESFLIHRIPPLGAHKMTEMRIIPLNTLRFAFFHWSATVAYYTAGPATNFIITREILRNHFF